jgi:hypothetical protein
MATRTPDVVHVYTTLDHLTLFPFKLTECYFVSVHQAGWSQTKKNSSGSL